MSDGYRVPGHPDAMGVFTLGDQLVLMRNHEITPGDRASGPYPDGVAAPAQAYDPAAFGGVTRLVLDRTTLALQRQELALCGTHWNCAGGLSPWGWLSCEEIVAPGHGYVFLVPHAARGLTAARAIPAYGRFRHEAASVDPQSLIAFLTEDREDAAFYRFLPHSKQRPFEGRLQALRVRDAAGFDTAAMALGQRAAIDWVDLPEADPADDSLRHQAHTRGAARFARTEGLWLAGDELYMCATTGGPIGRGQILRLRHKGAPQELSVVAHSIDPSVLDMPDNITVAPHGDLFVAEDGLDGNWIRRVSPQGVVRDFARNALSSSEFSGPCFTPDGRTLFVNLQHDGLSVAIQGPFEHPDAAAAHAAGAARSGDFGRLEGALCLGAGALVAGLAALMHRQRPRPRG